MEVRTSGRRRHPVVTRLGLAVGTAAMFLLATGCASDLGIAPVSDVGGVSANGWIVGYADAPGQPRAGFVRDPNGVVTRFGDGDHKETHMTAVNTTGQAVGTEDVWAVVGNLRGYRAVRWDPIAGYQLLSVPPTASLSRANGINDAGAMVGVTFVGISVVPLLWAPDGTYTELPFAGDRAQAFDINDAGDIVGYDTDPGQSAVWWDAATHTPHALPGGAVEGMARAINDGGAIVGSATIGDVPRATMWAAGTHELTVLPGGTHSGATAINDAGDVVGSARLPDGTWVAARWKAPAYEFESLGGMGGTWASASGITNRGEVYGTASTSDGVTHAVRF